MRILTPLLLLLTLVSLAPLQAQEGAGTAPNCVITYIGKPIAFDAFHASVIQSRVEPALQHTVNYLREGAPRANPLIAVSWSCALTFEIHSTSSGLSTVEIAKIDFQDFGPGLTGVGDILILASDLGGKI